MAQVSVVINGKSYRIACDDGEEPHLHTLAELVDKRVNQLVSSIGQIDHTRLLVMASLVIADELGDSKTEIATLKEKLKQAASTSAPASSMPASPDTDKLCDGIEKLAGRIEAIAERLSTT